MTHLIKDKGFKFVMMNIRSLYSSVDELALKFGNVDLIACCETWLNSSYTNEMINIDGFDIIRLDRSAGNLLNVRNNPKRGGGVLFYVSKKYEGHVSIIANCSKISHNLEQLWISITKPDVRQMIVGILYRPPTSKVKDSIEELTVSLDYMRSICNAEFLIAGDLNVNYNLRHSKQFEILKDFERKYNLTQLIKTPTRIVEGSKSLIDLIFTDVQYINSSGVINTEMSDHLPVFMVKKKGRDVKEYKYITGRTYSRYNKCAFQQDLVNHESWGIFWNSTTCDMELLWSYILHIIMEIADIHCPIRKMKICNDNPHWMSKEIIEFIKQKDESYRRARLSDQEEDWHAYRVIKNMVKSLIMNAKEEYIKEQHK